ITDADVVIRAECDPRHSCNLFLFQKLSAELGRLHTGRRNVREQVKRPARVDARKASDTIELLPRVHASTPEFAQPNRQMILRTVQCRHSALLREGSW